MGCRNRAMVLYSSYSFLSFRQTYPVFTIPTNFLYSVFTALGDYLCGCYEVFHPWSYTGPPSWRTVLWCHRVFHSWSYSLYLAIIASFIYGLTSYTLSLVPYHHDIFHLWSYATYLILDVIAFFIYGLMPSIIVTVSSWRTNRYYHRSKYLSIISFPESSSHYLLYTT